MNKVMVFGSKGMLGCAVTRYFRNRGYEVIEVSRAEYDIAVETTGKLTGLLDSKKPQLVVNCAGVIKPRMAAMPVESVVRVNSIFPRNLALVCLDDGIPCFHVTTDCVYSGNKGQYTERDLFDADDLYGMSKNAGENKDCMVLRTSIIGEEVGQSRSLLEWARSQKGREVSGFTNHSWNGVTTVYLAEMIERLFVEKKYERGLCHVHSPRAVTKFELLGIFNRVYDLGLKIQAKEAAVFCDRTLASIHPLSGNVCKKEISQQVEEMKVFFEKAR